jgi:hypothetical protein
MKRGALSKAMSSWGWAFTASRGFRCGYAKQQSHYRHAGDAVKAQAGEGRFAVLINNLGGVSALEMALLTKELAHSALKENCVSDWPGAAGQRAGYEGLFADAAEAQRSVRKSDSRRGRDAGLAEARGVCATAYRGA